MREASDYFAFVELPPPLIILLTILLSFFVFKLNLRCVINLGANSINIYAIYATLYRSKTKINILVFAKYKRILKISRLCCLLSLYFM